MFFFGEERGRLPTFESFETYGVRKRFSSNMFVKLILSLRCCLLFEGLFHALLDEAVISRSNIVFFCRGRMLRRPQNHRKKARQRIAQPPKATKAEAEVHPKGSTFTPMTWYSSEEVYRSLGGKGCLGGKEAERESWWTILVVTIK